ncbi:hypothetical protein M501DRAFT_930160 [Patellaria atrata CBS 101060]|uniref:Pre-rRNA processing protein n=1 Tax=Patellaria atrata CBS 101060 TaxID=1346257 RepID=A0A9P4VUM0_9PEZI|nr:hypothetical protein M501DRAFT_930160 [Patellaria atrata CBS 101060]
MAESLTWASTRTTSRPSSKKSSRSNKSHNSSPSEQTPLLSQETPHHSDDESVRDSPRSPATSALLRNITGTTPSSKKRLRRWPSFVALLLLCIAVILIMALGFFVPETVEEYATQAVAFEPTSLSIDSFTDNGVRARVQGDFYMDASKVHKKSVRDIGRFGTWLAKEVESEKSNVEVYMPEYGNAVLGTAVVPAIKVNIRNGHKTHLDFLTDLEPGSKDAIRRVARDWMEGRISSLSVRGKATVPLKSGIFNLGKQTIEQTLVFKGDDVPELPAYSIGKVNIHEVNIPGADNGVAADVSVKISNDYPLDFLVPSMSFSILVDNCLPSDPYISVADATTADIHVQPKTDITLNVTGIVRQLPESLTAVCPDSTNSPLDMFINDYIHGEDTTIYVKGSDSPHEGTPPWITELISGITIPVPFSGHTFGHLIRNFSLTDVNFHLPDPFAEPDTPEAQPKISAKIDVLVALPEEMNFPVDVDRVKANANVFYNDRKLGELNLNKWQKANSTRIEGHGDEPPTLEVQSIIKKVPLEITDQDVFTEVLEALLLGSSPVFLAIKAEVDVEMATTLGAFPVRRIPAEGIVPVKPIGKGDGSDKGGFPSVKLKVGELEIVDTTKTSITLQAKVNFTNPTKYTATIPFFDIEMLANDTVLGHGIVKNATVVPGFNENMVVTAVWDPFTSSGENGTLIGRELLSQYISGYNATITVKTHSKSVPAQPALGRALEKFAVTMPMPKLGGHKKPGGGDGDDGDRDGDDGPTKFIQDTTMHLLTSTALFHLLSPLRTTTIYLTSLNATAYYESHPAGHILYNLPFAVPPGLSESPRLPVDWNLGSVGYDAVRKALGGTLKLDAFAEAGVRIGMWREEVWVRTKGVGARVRL